MSGPFRQAEEPRSRPMGAGDLAGDDRQRAPTLAVPAEPASSVTSTTWVVPFHSRRRRLPGYKGGTLRTLSAITVLRQLLPDPGGWTAGSAGLDLGGKKPAQERLAQAFRNRCVRRVRSRPRSTRPGPWSRDPRPGSFGRLGFGGDPVEGRSAPFSGGLPLDRVAGLAQAAQDRAGRMRLPAGGLADRPRGSRPEDEQASRAPSRSWSVSVWTSFVSSNLRAGGMPAPVPRRARRVRA